MGHDPLSLDRESMRRLGYRTVDLLVERLNADGPPLRRATSAEMRERLSGPAPEQGEPFEELLAQLERDVLPFASRNDHPAFFAFVPSSGTWPGALGDFVASALNIYAGSWMESAGPSQVELEVIDWFRTWLGLPDGAGGLLLTGGSAANMTALATAREARAGPMAEDLVVYVSDQAHSSLARAARVLGFRPGQVCVLPSNRGFRLPPERLAAAIDADVHVGRRPMLVAASGGSTNSGAVDELERIAAVCRERDVWLHVDAAYGGFSVLTDRGRKALAGIELADSVTLDPHKWLHQPFECGGLLVRDRALLRRAFEITPDYLRDAGAHDAEVNFCDLGPQLTRSFRALKLWLSLRTFGLGAFRAAIDRALDLAEHARERIEASDELELAAPPSLGIVCFRRRLTRADAEEQEVVRAHAAMLDALESSGVGLVSSTRLHGRHALRMCVLNHTTGQHDVDAVLDLLERAPLDGAASDADGYERHPDVGRSWLRRVPVGAEPHGVDTSLFAGVPLFGSLSGPQLEQAAGLAVERREPGGATLVEQWEPSRDFFVLLEGEAEVLVDGEPVASVGPGEFFGELAAVDWGAGFGYPRLASVTATEPVHLVVFPDGSLNDLVAIAPAVGETIEQTMRDRLSRQR